ncbi:MAG TPA: DUF2141 domain-containing protein [Sphingomicrobium sp.]|nr:DUF2141 domain-containing protein [Sphingomicrobium sp.]
MSKTSLALAAALLAGMAAAAPAPAKVVGSDAEACLTGKPSMLVRVSGLKKPSGTVKVAVYAAHGYLAKRGKLRKVVVPVRSTAPMDVCIAVPKAGQYAVAVHHDLNGNGDKDLSDGGGYSGNPRLSITNLKPPFGKTAVRVGAAPRHVTVLLQYRDGLSIRPVNG